MSPPTGIAIEQRKLVDYLLDDTHPEGGPKARFFLARGFARSEPERLADALASHAAELWPGKVEAGQYGPKYILDGALATPTGTVRIRSVWQIRADAQAWLVTAYPI